MRLDIVLACSMGGDLARKTHMPWFITAFRAAVCVFVHLVFSFRWDRQACMRLVIVYCVVLGKVKRMMRSC